MEVVILHLSVPIDVALRAETALAPRICCAVVYKQLGEKMEFLWTKELKVCL